MNKTIAMKYTCLIVIVIILVTLVFLPIYLLVQKRVYIDLELNSMKSFYQEIIGKTDLTDTSGLEEFIEDYRDKNYFVVIYDSGGKQIFSSVKHRHEREKARMLSEEHRQEYSADAEPVYKEHDEQAKETIVMKKIVKQKEHTYFIRIRENLINVESIFSYTDETLAVILLLHILVCGFSMFLLMRRVTRSIRDLNVVVKQISKKDYSVRYEGKISGDEVGMLAENFNSMVDTIQDNITSIDNYNFLLKEDIANLKEYEDMRSSFVRTMTHELKTPLAIISSQIEMMHFSGDREKEDYYYGSAMEEIQKMSTLITNFLKFSVAEERTFRAETGKIDASAKIEKLCRKIEPAMHTKKLQFIYRIEPGAVILFSEIHIEYIFNNYIANAMKHTGKRGSIQVTLGKSEAGYRLSVFNEGEQIAEEQIENIWNEFYSSDRRTFTDNVGLGLFIVKEISLINHTECGVCNQPDGVEFWFDFME